MIRIRIGCVVGSTLTSSLCYLTDERAVRPSKHREEVRVDPTTQPILFYSRCSCIQKLLHPNRTSVPTAIMLAISCADLAIARLKLLTYGTVWWGGLTLPLMPHSVRCVPSPSIVLCHCIHALRNVDWLWPCFGFGRSDYKKKKRKKKFQTYSNFIFQSFHIPYRDSSINKKTMSCG